MELTSDQLQLEFEGDIMSARVVVVGNEKGGSGKSTVAMHVAIALIKSGQPVATVDLDTRQRSLTRLVENRRAWARHVGRDLDMPEHFCFGKLDYPTAVEEAAGCKALEETVETLAGRYGVVVIDTPGQTTICHG
jgi:chromosome partitioning protein